MKPPQNIDVKICGLTRPEDVEAAIEHGAAFLGFIVEAKSPRKLTVLQASTLAAPARHIIPRVAVTVNPNDDLVARMVSDMAPDYIQLHGDETVERAADIARRFNVKIIKAAPIAHASDMKTAEHYSGVCDFILYDAKPPKGEKVRGGHGLSFNWHILTAAPLPKVWALAGGLTPGNAREAIARTNAPILDVSSGVESAPGIKDAIKIKAFMEAAGHG